MVTDDPAFRGLGLGERTLRSLQFHPLVRQPQHFRIAFIRQSFRENRRRSVKSLPNG